MNPSEISLPAQLEERIRFETLLTDLSARFVGIPTGMLDHEINEALRRICETLGLRSNLSLPLLVGGKPMGVLSFGTFKTERQWPAHLVNRLRLLAEVFANALARRASEEALREALTAVEAMKARLEAENVSLRQNLQSLKEHPQILGRSAALRKVLAQVEQVAPTEALVLVLGETGTGKELIASAIHELSPRCDRAMVRINCAAIPSNLIESELFGTENSGRICIIVSMCSPSPCRRCATDRRTSRYWCGLLPTSSPKRWERASPPSRKAGSQHKRRSGPPLSHRLGQAPNPTSSSSSVTTPALPTSARTATG